MLHLFAVDEGILLAGDTDTPDPHGHFFAKRQSLVTTADLFPDLLPDMHRPADMVKIGGGAGKYESRERLRRNPVPTKQREPAIVWATAVPADEQGRAEFTLELPKLTGAVRLMAVAVCGDRYGSAEQRLVVAGPLGIEAGWPRFLAPGDRVALPLKLFNRTETATRLALELQCDGAVQVVSTDLPSELEVPAGGDVTVYAELEATGIGPASVRAAARSDSGLATDSTADFPVRPATPLIVRSHLERIPAGESHTIPPAEDVLAGAHRTVVVSAEPALDLRPAVEALIDYPYGCVEQITSRLFALLHATALIALEEEPGRRAEIVGDMLRRGMDRYYLMQTRGGGLAYWPGGSRPSRFGSAYAASFLLAARDAGREPPPGILPPLLGYLARELSSPAATNAERALIVRVLAAFDRPDLGWMTRLAEIGNTLDLAARAHLAAAWFEAGRRDRAVDLLPASLGAFAVPATTRGRLTSTVRQLGVLLDVLLTVDPEHPLLPHLARRLDESRENHRWGSTLSNAAAVAALARYRLQRSQEEPEYTVRIRCGDAEFSADHTETREFELPADESPVEVTCDGRGTAHVIVRTEGLARTAEGLEHDHGLVVRKRWFTSAGAPVDPRSVSVGDLVQVAVTLSAPAAERGKTFGNIAVLDLLPAGFEVENPRLATSAARGRVRLGQADRVEFLDDRVIVFAGAGREERTFTWFLRVVAGGRFAIPPTQASCMYVPELSSIHGEGAMEVRR
jgi:uncharacterized protein YfaS (alpha-2-macroglobulin family)